MPVQTSSIQIAFSPSKEEQKDNQESGIKLSTKHFKMAIAKYLYLLGCHTPWISPSERNDMDKLRVISYSVRTR